MNHISKKSSFISHYFGHSWGPYWLGPCYRLSKNWRWLYFSATSGHPGIKGIGEPLAKTLGFLKEKK